MRRPSSELQEEDCFLPESKCQRLFSMFTINPTLVLIYSLSLSLYWLKWSSPFSVVLLSYNRGFLSSFISLLRFLSSATLLFAFRSHCSHQPHFLLQRTKHSDNPTVCYLPTTEGQTWACNPAAQHTSGGFGSWRAKCFPQECGNLKT